MSQQRGFTLIELIIVIVILGILAVTAAPRFIDLQSDAKVATLNGVKAALQGGAQLVYAKSAINGSTSGSGTVTLSGVSGTLATLNGYPDAESFRNIRSATLAGSDVSAFAELDSAEFDILESQATSNGAANTAATDDEFVIVFSGADAGNACSIRYQNAASGGTPTITVNESGC